MVVRVNKLGDPAAWLDGIVQAYKTRKLIIIPDMYAYSLTNVTGQAAKSITGDYRDWSSESVLGLEQRQLDKGRLRYRRTDQLGYRDEKVSESLHRYWSLGEFRRLCPDEWKR